MGSRGCVILDSRIHSRDHLFLENCRMGITGRLFANAGHLLGDAKLPLNLCGTTFVHSRVWDACCADEVEQCLFDTAFVRSYGGQRERRNKIVSCGIVAVCKMGHVGLLNEFLDTGILAVSPGDFFVQNLLRNSARLGQRQICGALMSRGACPYTTVVGSIKPDSLVKAAASGHFDILQDMLGFPATSPDEVSNRTISMERAIRHAAREGMAGCVALLADHGCNVDARSVAGATALMLACVNRHLATATLLCELGADLRIHSCSAGVVTPYGQYGLTGCPMVYSIKRVQPHLYPSTEDVEIRTVLRRAGECVEVKGLTALHFACLSRSCALVDTLLECGADLCATGAMVSPGKVWTSYTPLSLAMEIGDAGMVAHVVGHMRSRCLCRERWLLNVFCAMLMGVQGKFGLDVEIFRHYILRDFCEEYECIFRWLRDPAGCKDVPMCCGVGQGVLF